MMAHTVPQQCRCGSLMFCASDPQADPEAHYKRKLEAAAELLLAAEQAVSVWPSQMRGSTLEAAIVRAKAAKVDGGGYG